VNVWFVSILAEQLAPSGRVARRSTALEFADRVILAFVTAEAVAPGMRVVTSLLRRDGGAVRVEWWAPTDDGAALRLEAADGRSTASCRTALPLGPAGALVVVGAGWAPRLTAAVNRLAPLVRRRWTDEQLARRVVELARRNEALEDYASLVAHELKAPLHAALLQQDPVAAVESALDLVDALLEVARNEHAPGASSTPADSLAEALGDLGATEVEVVSNLPERFPLPSASLRLVFRNLLGNAVAAGARNISVAAVDDGDSRMLVVDDDGAGIGGDYASGSGIGLGLINRLVTRHGGSVELAPRPQGGTRALLALPCVQP
jgi:signal transduction histidine kinase